LRYFFASGAALLPASQPNRLTRAHDLQWAQHAQRRRHQVVQGPSDPNHIQDTLDLRSRSDHAARPLLDAVVEESILAPPPQLEKR